MNSVLVFFKNKYLQLARALRALAGLGPSALAGRLRRPAGERQKKREKNREREREREVDQTGQDGDGWGRLLGHLKDFERM